MIGRTDLLSDPRFITTELRSENRIELEGIFQAWLDQHTQSQVFKAAQDAGIPGGPVLTPKDVMSDKHFKDREFFLDMKHKEFGTLTYPGAPFRMADMDKTQSYTAPLLGEHNEAVLGDWLGMSSDDISLAVTFKSTPKIP